MYEDYKKYAIDHYCQDYEDIIAIINGFSDEELDLVINDLPDDYEQLQNAISIQIETTII